MYDSKAMNILLEGKQSLWLPILSGSMAPSLLPGDELYIEPLSEKIQSGDIIVFFARGKFFSHRVLCFLHWGKRGYILEKGDANHQLNIVPSKKALGKVTQWRRGGATVSLMESGEKKAARKKALDSFLHFLMYPFVNFFNRVKRRLKK